MWFPASALPVWTTRRGPAKAAGPSVTAAARVVTAADAVAPVAVAAAVAAADGANRRSDKV